MGKPSARKWESRWGRHTAHKRCNVCARGKLDIAKPTAAQKLKLLSYDLNKIFEIWITILMAKANNRAMNSQILT
ncbi:hypothetical protein V6N13_073589 [Hibiscus sabdariffa]